MDHQFLAKWPKYKRRQLALRSGNFTILAGLLYKKETDQVLRRFVSKHKKHSVLVEAHQGVAGGHLGKDITYKKI